MNYIKQACQELHNLSRELHKNMDKRVNVYVCHKCGKEVVTIDRVDGTTPFVIKCSECGEMARSSFYNVNQDLTPTVEFYKPDKEEYDKLDEELKEYVDRGCLLYRRINEY